jgi:hypothetical protein
MLARLLPPSGQQISNFFCILLRCFRLLMFGTIRTDDVRAVESAHPNQSCFVLLANLTKHTTPDLIYCLAFAQPAKVES